MAERREYMDDYQDKTLYIPGPIEMCKDIIAEICQPMFSHHTDRMADLYTTIAGGTKELLGTDDDVMTLTGSGTEIWESSTFNLVDENILVLTCGSFSKRRANVTECLGKNVDRIEYEWGQAVKPEDIREAPESSGKQYDVIATVMNKSSTDVRNPTKEIGDVVAEYPDTYLVVDTVLAPGDGYVGTDEYSIGAIFIPSQKVFVMPPGLVICTVSNGTYERKPPKGSTSWCDGFQCAFDYYDRKDQIRLMPAVSIMLVHRKQMKHMLEGGHEGRDKRHCEMIKHTREWAYEYSDMLPEENCESQTVACIGNTQGIGVVTTVEEINEEYDVASSNGYGSALGEKMFRIGHVDEHDAKSIKALTGAIEDVVDL